MRIKIDYHSGKPVYRQIVEEFIKGIGRGEFKNNAPLPSVRELAEKLSINPNTVAKAYRELEREGYIYSRPGIGVFVKASKKEIEKSILIQFENTIREGLKFTMSHGIPKEKCIEVLFKILEDLNE